MNSSVVLLPLVLIAFAEGEILGTGCFGHFCLLSYIFVLNFVLVSFLLLFFFSFFSFFSLFKQISVLLRYLFFLSL